METADAMIRNERITHPSGSGRKLRWLNRKPAFNIQQLQREQFIDLTLTIGKRVHPHTDALEQRQVEIRQRRGFRVLDVPPACNTGGAAPGDQNREIYVIVDVGIAHAAAVEIQ